jgi:hypothetical protein
MATWLWNTRNEYPISHAISKWLLDEALAVGETEAIELGNRNCALHGAPHQLRRGWAVVRGTHAAAPVRGRRTPCDYAPALETAGKREWAK